MTILWRKKRCRNNNNSNDNVPKKEGVTVSGLLSLLVFLSLVTALWVHHYFLVVCDGSAPVDNMDASAAWGETKKNKNRTKFFQRFHKHNNNNNNNNNNHTTTATKKKKTREVTTTNSNILAANDGNSNNNNNNIDSSSNNHDDNDDDWYYIPRVHFLVEWIGKEIYGMVNKPKYKYFLFMTIGTLPNEENTIALLSTMCNILYGVLTLLGFLLLPRGPMLFVTITTLWIGPALVLIVLGSVGMMLAAFAMYPCLSVAVMCLWFFFTSQLAQAIGQRLGLDRDGDGDVDCLDLLFVLAKTSWGQRLGLMNIHDLLNNASQDRIQKIQHRLSTIDHVFRARFVHLEERTAKMTNGTAIMNTQDAIIPNNNNNKDNDTSNNNSNYGENKKVA